MPKTLGRAMIPPSLYQSMNGCVDSAREIDSLPVKKKCGSNVEAGTASLLEKIVNSITTDLTLFFCCLPQSIVVIALCEAIHTRKVTTDLMPLHTGLPYFSWR